MLKLRYAAILLAMFVLGGVSVGGIFAAMHGDGEVRVAVQRLADGRTEVAVQERQADGTWSERLLPEKRFLPADAPTGRWLTSSAVQTGVEPQEQADEQPTDEQQDEQDDASQSESAADSSQGDSQGDSQGAEAVSEGDAMDSGDAMAGSSSNVQLPNWGVGGPYPGSRGGGGGGGPIAPPPATTFRDYERAEFVRTTEDDTATFALDVDQTSYRLALNWARDGYAIDPNSVRAEEWINSFDYGYAAPAGDRFFAVASHMTAHPLDDDRRLVRISIQAPELEDDRPLNVTLVLDASGSMGTGNRVEIARAAAESIRGGLRSGDRIAVVQFSDSVIEELVVEPTRSGDAAVRRSIEQLRPNQSTNVQAGLDRGVQLADEMRRERPDAYHYIILMSDGVANVDATDPFAILDQVGDDADRNPLRLIAVGVGIANYNDYLLEQLAQHGNGWYRYLSTPEESRSTFSRENWLALSRPFADQARAQVVWDPQAVAGWRLIGYENRVTSDQSFTEDRREFAEIPSGAATTVFFEIEPTAAARGGAVELGRVELRWLTPTDGEARSQQAAITGAAAPAASEASALLEFGALAALAADRYSGLPALELEGADAATVRGQLDELRERLGGLQERLGRLDAYRDFRFLLDHLRNALPTTASRSGYSR